MKKDKSYQNLFLIAFFVFNIYYSYRYIFKYNSETTSPTYSDTPLAFQAAKYVIAVAVCLVFIYYLIKYNAIIRLRFVECALIICGVFVLFKSVQQSSLENFVKQFIFIVPAYVIGFINGQSFKDRFIQLNKWLLFYHIAYSFIQIFLYVAIDRLPALAYKGGLVRFGGAWDDPNAFALYLIIPICYIECKILENKMTKNSLYKHYLLLIICILLELLTFSFTGYLCLLIACFCLIIRYRKNRRLWNTVFVVLCLGAAVLIVFFNKIIALVADKMGSLLGHLSYFKLEVSNDDFFSGLLFGDNTFTFSENYYNIIFQNYGLPYFIISVCLYLYFIYIGYKTYMCDGSVFAFIRLVFMVLFAIAQISLPFFTIFPVNYIYWIAVFSSLHDYRRRRVVKVCNKLKSGDAFANKIVI